MQPRSRLRILGVQAFALAINVFAALIRLWLQRQLQLIRRQTVSVWRARQRAAIEALEALSVIGRPPPTRRAESGRCRAFFRKLSTLVYSFSRALNKNLRTTCTSAYCFSLKTGWQNFFLKFQALSPIYAAKFSMFPNEIPVTKATHGRLGQVAHPWLA